MKFIANENFPKPSIDFLRERGVDIKAIVELEPGITDEKVMQLAIEEERTILTHDSDYGELIFRYGYKPQAGVVLFRMYNFKPVDPGKILLALFDQHVIFQNRMTVVDEGFIRQRSYSINS
jgi:predicted nuclease of predicted toxin-antitoxin system